MPASIRRATPIVALSLLLAACGPQAQANPQSTIAPTSAPTAAPTAAPTVAPTATPEPTAVPTLAKNITVAGVKVGGLDVEAAREKLSSSLEAVEPLTLATSAVSLTLEPGQIGLAPDLDAMMEEALQAKAGDDLPLALAYDEAKLRAALEETAEEIGGGDTGLDVIRDTELISASFVLRAAERLDVDAALAQVDQHLKGPEYTEPLTLELVLEEPKDGARPTKEQLQAELNAMAEEFGGVFGVYIHDLESDSELASLNKGTAFSTASTIKVAIMLNAYAHVEKFSAKQQKALEAMIIDSDNLKANDVLAASVGGTATDQAFEGAQLMSDMLAELGMPTTYQYTPFEANDFIKLYKPKYTVGPKQDGEKPFVSSSRVQRTTPVEMAQIYRLIEQCERGEGLLIEQFPETLNAKRCGEMVALLKKNADTTRMVSGLPEDADVAHKSGWAQPEVQGDAGIVRTPGGDFIISVYAYQAGEKYKDKFIQRLLGNVTRLAYTYYNPLVVGGEE